jgi:UDP-2-acetamido-2-deoxy-ribo-hexuluronate aminotransferase
MELMSRGIRLGAFWRGAIVTNDSALAELIESLRVYGKVTPTDAANRNFHHDPKYLSLRVGMNSRLDTLQAAILLEKLKIFADEIEARERVAQRYTAAFTGKLRRVPKVIAGGQSVWAQYVIEHADRDGLQAHLTANGIPSMVYYPVPIHQQDFAARFAPPPGSLPVTEEASRHVLALPMHPYLDAPTQDRVIETVLAFNG